VKARDLCQTHGDLPSIECASCERVSKALLASMLPATAANHTDVAAWFIAYRASEYELAVGAGKARALEAVKTWARSYAAAAALMESKS
jgi:hypothetical protein